MNMKFKVSEITIAGSAARMIREEVEARNGQNVYADVGFSTFRIIDARVRQGCLEVKSLGNGVENSFGAGCWQVAQNSWTIYSQ